MTASDFVDLDERIATLDDIALVKAHAGLHARDRLTDAEMHAHHALTRQMAARGIPTGYTVDPYAMVKIAVDYEEVDTTVVDPGVLYAPDVAEAIDEFTKTTGATTVALHHFLGVDGYEVVVKHGSHDQSSHGRKGARTDFTRTGDSMLDKVRENGGLSIRADGSEPKTGYMVAVRGHNLEIPEADYFDPEKGPAIVTAWAKEKKAEFTQPGMWLGVWHDKEHGEVVLDVSQQFRNKTEAIKAGGDRNQQSIWDVRNMVEIPTGGTGDRADKAAGGLHGGGPGAGGDDGPGDRSLGASGVGEDDAAAVEKRTYTRDSNGRFAATSGGGGPRTGGLGVPVDRAYEAHLARQPKPKMRHGSDALTDADHDTLRRILPKRVLSMEYNESYDRGVQHRDGDATPGMLGRFHERMTTNMAAVRGRTALTGSFEVESLAANVAQDAGFIDGAMGRKRKYRRPLWGTDGYGVISGTLGRVGAEFGKSIDDAADWFDATDVTKHLGNRHDQRTHARGGGGLSGVSIRRPGEQPDGDKPDLIEITDQFGDKIRVTKNDSLYDHLERKPDGGWGLTAEREALHDEIVAETLAGVPGGKAEPTMYMLGGGPAAGKTTMLNQGGIDVPTTGEGGSKRMAVLVNADEVKMALPEFGGSPEAGRSWKQAAGFVHEESSLLSKRIQQAAVAAKMDIVLDGTGDSKPNKLAAKIAEARRAGYKVEGHYATVPTGVAVTRSRNRGTHPVQDRYGRTVYRVVPDSIVMGTHSAVSDTFPKAQHLFDRVTVYDTTNGARRIAGREPGKRLQIDDQQAWQMFLSKGDE